MTAEQELLRYKDVWTGAQPAPVRWLPSGIAVEGDFAGIQNYVLRPVPGAKGAAKRLRARSFQVAEETQRIANLVCRELGVAAPFYVAGGRFLVCAAPRADWAERTCNLQARVDRDVFDRFGGEVAFHLSAAPYEDGLIPGAALAQARETRRTHPLEHVLLLEGNAWNETAFFTPAAKGWGKCPACLRTMPAFVNLEDQDICTDCNADVDLGTRLSQWRFEPGRRPAVRREELLHHFPRVGYEPASFEDLAASAAGKEWLGHLRIDVDFAGRHFDQLQNRPDLIWGLSRFLHKFFTARVQELLGSAEFRLIYPVYGGGDDLYIIGPWDRALQFAVRLRNELKKLAPDRDLTFSAGFALGKPHQHVLTKSDEAAEALHLAKQHPAKNAVCALGQILPWEEFEKVLRRSRDVLRWYQRGAFDGLFGLRDPAPPDLRSGALNSGFLQNILWLSQAGGNVARGKWKPLLNHQFRRNVRSPDEYCRKWILGMMTSPDEWRRAPLVVRLALLAAGRRSADSAAT